MKHRRRSGGESVRITELRSESEFREAFPVMRELHDALDEERYAELLAEMIPAGYRLFAVREAGSIVALAGVQVLTNLYYGRHVYVYDLVATADARSKGYGEKLLSHVEELGRREGCGYVALACGRERTQALRFYEERMGYERPGYSMRKSLDQDRRQGAPIWLSDSRQ